MFKKDVLFIVPTVDRDLPGYAYIAYILETKYRLKTKIMPDINYIPLLHILLYKPNIVVSYQVSTKFTENLFEECKHKNIQTVSIRTEGIVNELNENIFKSHYDYRNIVGLQIYWGKSFQKMIESFDEIDPNKGITCGNPSFDFYKPYYSKYYLQREEFLKLHSNKNYYKKIVVIATNFVSTNKDINNLDTFPEFIDNPTKEEIEVCKKFIDRDIQSSSVIINVINEISIKYQDVFFIIKIHPRENNLNYMQHLKNKHNVMVIKNEMFLWDLINISDVLLHPGSTLSILFKMMNKKTVRYELYDEGMSDNELWDTDKLLTNTHDFDNFFENLLLADKNDNETNLNSAIFEKWFYKNDCNASKRCADEIYKLFETKITIKGYTNNQFKKEPVNFYKNMTTLLLNIVAYRTRIINKLLNYRKNSNEVERKRRLIYALIEKINSLSE